MVLKIVPSVVGRKEFWRAIWGELYEMLVGSCYAAHLGGGLLAKVKFGIWKADTENGKSIISRKQILERSEVKNENRNFLAVARNCSFSIQAW